MRDLLNDYGRKRRPCLFVIDFDMKEPFVCPLEDAAGQGVFFAIRGRGNRTPAGPLPAEVVWRRHPVPFDEYKRAFDLVQDELRRGNTYLVNLTFPTPVDTNLDLGQLFDHSLAPFRLWYKDRLVAFSPEEFVAINGNTIRTCPMKGTIRADVDRAAEIILADEKEKAEHVTVVDLLRNDLSIVARGVRVERWRYIDEVKTHEGRLLQVSSEITGRLEPDWYGRLGDIMAALLPAGSVTGAPKKKTVEIIRRVESYNRGFYTGVFGVYDGRDLSSGVLIRLVERDGRGGLVYKSGGGVTMDSVPEAEYRELVEKVYAPFA